MVRIQEAPWGLTQTLLLTPQEYYAFITLHGMRDLFRFCTTIRVRYLHLLHIQNTEDET
jgi:heme/copper-type cytochrome/quinol oxidase subunit 1